jgi:hypothetical protein
MTSLYILCALGGSSKNPSVSVESSCPTGYDVDIVSGAGNVDACRCGRHGLTVKDAESDVYMKQLIV